MASSLSGWLKFQPVTEDNLRLVVICVISRTGCAQTHKVRDCLFLVIGLAVIMGLEAVQDAVP
jgi:hypothetical protein